MLIRPFLKQEDNSLLFCLPNHDNFYSLHGVQKHTREMRWDDMIRTRHVSQKMPKKHSTLSRPNSEGVQSFLNEEEGDKANIFLRPETGEFNSI